MLGTDVRSDRATPCRRWIAACAAAEAVGMTAAAGAAMLAVLGATLPDTGWPAGAVLVTGTVTGAAAGAALGLVSGLFLPTLSGVSASSRAVMALLASARPPGLQRALVGLAVRGRDSGRRYRFPVQYAVAPGGLAIVPGRPGRKTWWRNVAAAPTPVEVLREGVWATASARLLAAGDPAYDAVLAAYLERWPGTRCAPEQPVVLVRLGAAASTGPPVPGSTGPATG